MKVKGRARNTQKYRCTVTKHSKHFVQSEFMLVFDYSHCRVKDYFIKPATYLEMPKGSITKQQFRGSFLKFALANHDI